MRHRVGGAPLLPVRRAKVGTYGLEAHDLSNSAGSARSMTVAMRALTAGMKKVILQE